MKLVIINRGVPGGGKSTFSAIMKKLAEKLGLTCSVHCTDDLFMEDGEYKFDFRKLGFNHKKNFQNFKAALDAESNIAICDNTNTKPKDYKKYALTASETGYKVLEVIFLPDTEENHNKRNTHGVPAEVIANMIHNLNNNLPSEFADDQIKVNPNVQYKTFDDKVAELAKSIISDHQ